MTLSRRISRRSLLKLGATAALPLAAPRAYAQSIIPPSKDPPRNIIFMVSDGMSPGVPALAQAFSRLVRNTGTNWHRLASDPQMVRGSFDMASLNSLVTDSAAASTSWASGSRIFNWALNMLPDGRKLTPIGVLATQAGRAVGLVTTTRITHATPAGFAAAVPKRDQEDDIAPQYLNVIDVLLGGGMKHFDPAKRADKRDLIRNFRAANYTIRTSRDDLLKNTGDGKKLLGLFDPDHLPYAIDRNRDEAIATQVPTLAEMTQAALAMLSKSDKGFLLQIEGGRVDHAAHDNDAPAMLWDQLAFDDAIGIVMGFQRDHPDTLVVITSDHGTGNPGLNGMGGSYQRSTTCFERLANASASFDAMAARFASLKKGTDSATPEAVIDVMKWGSGLTIDSKDATVIASVLGGKPLVELNKSQSGVAGAVAQILGNQTGIGWTGLVHTSDWTLSLAFGPGSGQFSGLLKNTDAFDHMTKFMGIDHRNPSMTAEEAKKFAAATIPKMQRTHHV